MDEFTNRGSRQTPIYPVADVWSLTNTGIPNGMIIQPLQEIDCDRYECDTPSQCPTCKGFLLYQEEACSLCLQEPKNRIFEFVVNSEKYRRVAREEYVNLLLVDISKKSIATGFASTMLRGAFEALSTDQLDGKQDARIILICFDERIHFVSISKGKPSITTMIGNFQRCPFSINDLLIDIDMLEGKSGCEFADLLLECFTGYTDTLQTLVPLRSLIYITTMYNLTLLTSGFSRNLGERHPCLSQVNVVTGERSVS